MSKQSLFPDNFSHIYVEQKALSYKMTQDILAHFKNSTIIYIRHYKDVFNRPGQDAALQDGSKSLILAVNEGAKIFRGSPVCQDFGEDRFYYVQSAMNCVFSCDYCFLKGMYATSNVVVFVNTEDYLDECSRMLKDGPMYLCASFDTDLTALSSFCSWQEIWSDFAEENPDLTIEFRTKSVTDKIRSSENIIYAFTLSPDEVIRLYEKKTPSLDARMDFVNRAIDKGASVRLCFDPVVYIKDFELCYNDFIGKVLENIDLSKVRDMSIGTFRISADYLSNLRKACPCSAAVNFPFDRENGFCVYPKPLRSKMISILEEKIRSAGYGQKLYIIS